ncbi:MAG: hypothetical protein AB8B96_22175 [Lysobacterales bacterium]
MKTGFVLFALLFSGSVFAGNQSPGVDWRQQNQTQRIAAGVANGTVTRPERVALVSQQRTIARTERVFKRDGHLGRAERHTLHQMQSDASRTIYRQKHDRQRRF